MDMRSNSTEGHPFWRSQTNPWYSSVVVAGTFGVRRPSVPNVRRPFGSSTPALTKPRGL